MENNCIEDGEIKFNEILKFEKKYNENRKSKFI